MTYLFFFFDELWQFPVLHVVPEHRLQVLLGRWPPIFEHSKVLVELGLLILFFLQLLGDYKTNKREVQRWLGKHSCHLSASVISDCVMATYKRVLFLCVLAP